MALRIVVFEILTMSMSFLLGYVKKHAKECYEEGQRPRKLLILIMFGIICLILLGIEVTQ